MTRLKSILPLLLSACLAGCVGKAEPSIGGGFIPIYQLTQYPDLPFQKAWYRSNTAFDHYSEIHVAPVDTRHLLDMDWWDQTERKDQLKRDVETIGQFTERALRGAILNDPYHRFRLTEKIGPKTLILEMAVTEIIPNKAVLESLSYAAGPAGKLVALAVSGVTRSVSRSTVAFEARLRDGATGEIIAMFADREYEKGSIVNVKNFSWYAHAESIIEEWSDQWVQVLKKKPGEKIKEPGTFEWKPW